MITYNANISNPVVLVIDSAHTLRRSCYQPSLRELSNSIGTPTGGIYGYFNSLRSAISSMSAQSIVVCHEGGHSQRRKSVYSEYKKRDVEEEPARDVHGYTDYEYYSHQLSWIECILDNLGLIQLRVPGKEGDDVIFQVTRLLKGQKIIISEDSDFFSIISEDVAVYRPIKKVYVDLSNFSEVTGFPSPRHYLYSKVLLGDGSDNIPGVCKGVGSKTVRDILCKIENPEEVTPDRVIKEASTFKHSRYHKIVEAGTSPIIRNLDLIDISREKFNLLELQDLSNELTRQRYINVGTSMKLFNSLEFNPANIDSLVNRMSSISNYNLSHLINKDYMRRVMLGSTSVLQG